MRYRFRDFELDTSAAELRQGGQRVHLQEQPLRLLLKLAEHPGTVVSRVELERALWPDGTVVDYEIGINNAVRKLRQALGDTAERQASIETIPRRGYCLRETLIPVDAAQEAAAAAEPRNPPARKGAHLQLAAMTAVAAVILALGLGWVVWRPAAQPRVRSIRELTSDGGLDLPAKPVSRDGYLYYLDRRGDQWVLMRTRADANEPVQVAMPFPNPRLFDISPDGRRWLLGSVPERDAPAPVWLRNGDQAPVRLAGLTAYDAIWYPDGKRFLFSRPDGLWTADADGSDARFVAGLEGVATWFSWSPDGTRVRFSMMDDSGANAIWQWQPGGAPQPVFPGTSEQRCCGDWSRDGRFFLYSAMHGGVWNVWAQSSLRHIWRPASTPPVQLTVEPESAQGAFTGFTPGSVVFYQWHNVELPQRLDLRTRQFEPLLSGRDGIHLVYSRDGAHLAFLDLKSATVWSAEVATGGEIANPRRLTPFGTPAAFPRWSPDGSELAYTAHPERQLERAMVVAAAGGEPRPLVTAMPDADISQADWSPDGRRVVVALRRRLPSGWRASLAIVDLASQRVTELPGSTGLAAPRWSPDGRSIAAFSEDQRRLMVYAFADATWRELATGRAFTIPVWTRDSVWIYYQDLLAPGEPLARVAAASGRREAVAEFSAALRSGYHRCGFMDLAPDGSPLIAFNRGTANLRVATLELPLGTAPGTALGEAAFSSIRRLSRTPVRPEAERRPRPAKPARASGRERHSDPDRQGGNRPAGLPWACRRWGFRAN